MEWVFIILGAAALIIPFCYLQNNLLTHTRFTLHSEKIDREVRIVHLTDLHSKIFKKKSLYREVLKEKPDIIVFTGDVADRYKDDTAAVAAADELCELISIAPVYAVSGNHEYGRLRREELFSYMENKGIHLLRGKGDNFHRISIFGLDEIGWPVKTQGLLEGFEREDGFKLLLSHFPHRFVEEYSKYDIDLTLCGHAHGGQFRLPFIGGLYSPDQGLLPKYSEGIHELNGRRMIVSRGLGNSRFPLRLFNYPEIVTIDIRPVNQ